MKRILFIISIFNIIYLSAQNPLLGKDETLLVITVNPSGSYDKLKTGCSRPVFGMEKWVETLMSRVESNPDINRDSLQSTLLFEIDDEGQLSSTASIEKSSLVDSFLIESIVDLGPWSTEKGCNEVEIRLLAKNLEVYTIVDEPASFPGGFDAFREYLAVNITYPEEAQKAGVEGRVFVQFIIEQDGSISDIKVVKGIGGSCDQEALRVINEMPNWIPGKHDGEPVRQKMIQNINFQFAKTKADKKKLRKQQRDSKG